MLEKVSAVPLVQQSDPGFVAYNQLAGIFLLNLLVPWVQVYSNRWRIYETDCYDSCGLTMIILMYVFWIPALIIWGTPLATMGLYSIFGRRLGFKGHLVKFLILYATRYTGLLWHIIS